MSHFVLLLRGINVGKAKRVPMADLRELLAGLGHAGIATSLNSGNAVFQSTGGSASRHAAQIAAALADRFGFEVPVVVKSGKEFGQVMAGNPLPKDSLDPARVLVAFTQDHRSLAGLAALEALAVAPERFVVGPHAAYLLCAGGVLESPVGKALLGKAGAAVTTRNWATVLKLQGLLEDGA